MNIHILKLFSILILSSIILTSCLKDNDDLNNLDVPQGGFTMMNVYSSTNFVIHKADNNFIQSMNSPLQFKGINFAYLFPGNRKIQTIDFENKILIDSTYTIKDGLLYSSIIYTKTNEKAGQILTEDKLLSDIGNNAAYRFLNLANNMTEADLYIGDTKVVDNRAFDGANFITNNYKFESIVSGAKKIIVKNQADEVLAEKDITLNTKVHYSMILIRNMKNNNNYELIVYEQYKN